MSGLGLFTRLLQVCEHRVRRGDLSQQGLFTDLATSTSPIPFATLAGGTGETHGSYVRLSDALEALRVTMLDFPDDLFGELLSLEQSVNWIPEEAWTSPKEPCVDQVWRRPASWCPLVYAPAENCACWPPSDRAWPTDMGEFELDWNLIPDLSSTLISGQQELRLARRDAESISSGGLVNSSDFLEGLACRVPTLQRVFLAGARTCSGMSNQCSGESAFH